jgi:16S rRNA (guanine1207-N2)-methyltransferase
MSPRPQNSLPRASNHYFSSDTGRLSPEEQGRAPVLSVEVDGVQLQFLTGANTFSKSALDEGSQLLVETLWKHGDFPDKARVCDLGCGWGAVGAMWATLNPGHLIFALDVNPRAVQLAGLNFARNALENAVAWCGDGLGAARSEFFDLVAFNPPIRAGNATIERLFADAHRTLKPGGELWAVIRTAQGAKTWAKKLERVFGCCETVEMRAGYRILKATKC